MLKLLFSNILILGLVFTTFPQTVTPLQTLADIPAWTAPTPRDKVKTPFDPKPTVGNNIFKGEAEEWLSDAIVKLEAGHLEPIKDKEVSDYVTSVGQNLLPYSRAAKKPFEFVVLCDDEEDSFSIGAGRIFITLGMLETVANEDEMAGIRAHEIGHDAFFHGPKTVTRQLFWMTGVSKVKSAAETESSLRDLLAAYQKNKFALVGEALLGWSRNDEFQADKAGFYTIYKAG